MEIQNKKINFWGDSITEGIGVSSPDHKYVDIFYKKYRPAVVRNYGISGTRFAKQQQKTKDNPSFDQDFCSRVKKMDPDADIVIVFGGINDFEHGDAPFGNYEDRTENTFCGACHILMTSLIEHFPNALIVFMTPLHCIEEIHPGKRCLGDYVQAIRTSAEFYSIPVLDMYKMSGIQPQIPILRERLIPDGVHPNDAGAERIADCLGAFLQNL